MWFSTSSFQLQRAVKSALATTGSSDGRKLPMAAWKSPRNAWSEPTCGSGQAKTMPSHTPTAAGRSEASSKAISGNWSPRCGTAVSAPFKS
ncbi:MAG: hypothetical protein M3P85_14195 [Actinomycetota bacterium]|nr:hypothetical protein [Actinomycetota bacterium]